MSNWRPIPTCPGYEASDEGQVRSIERTLTNVLGQTRRWRTRVLSLHLDRDGYQAVHVLGHTRRVHALVAAAFHGPRPAVLEIRHLDGDKQNNRPENLRYGTTAQNTLDQVRHGRHHEARREECPRGHALEGANLLPAQLRAGKRSCLACNRAYSTARRVRQTGGTVDFAALADAKYQQILAQPGPLPANRRSIPALAGVTWGGKR